MDAECQMACLLQACHLEFHKKPNEGHQNPFEGNCTGIPVPSLALAVAIRMLKRSHVKHVADGKPCQRLRCGQSVGASIKAGSKGPQGMLTRAYSPVEKDRKSST